MGRAARAYPSTRAVIFARSLRSAFGESIEIFHIMTLARKLGSATSANFVTVVDPPASRRVKPWWTRPRAPTESQPNADGGASSVMVLCQGRSTASRSAIPWDRGSPCARRIPQGKPSPEETP